MNFQVRHLPWAIPKSMIIMFFGLFSVVIHAKTPYQTYVIHTHGDPSLVAVVQNELSPAYGGSGGSATLYQDRLIIRATPADYARILPLIQQIDSAPTPLIVSVALNNQLNHHQSGGYINGGIIHQEIWINGQYRNNTSQHTTNAHYSVRTQSGSPVRISTDTLLGLTTYRSYHQGRTWVNFGTTWVTLQDGFSAIPQLLPNGQIRLNISTKTTHQNSLAGSGIDTAITIPRGQWVQIGEIRRDSQDTTNYEQNSQQQTMPVWIKVD